MVTLSRLYIKQMSASFRMKIVAHRGEQQLLHGSESSSNIHARLAAVLLVTLQNDAQTDVLHEARPEAREHSSRRESAQHRKHCESAPIPRAIEAFGQGGAGTGRECLGYNSFQYTAR